MLSCLSIIFAGKPFVREIVKRKWGKMRWDLPANSILPTRTNSPPYGKQKMSGWKVGYLDFRKTKKKQRRWSSAVFAIHCRENWAWSEFRGYWKRWHLQNFSRLEDLCKLDEIDERRNGWRLVCFMSGDRDPDQKQAILWSPYSAPA